MRNHKCGCGQRNCKQSSKCCVKKPAPSCIKTFSAQPTPVLYFGDQSNNDDYTAAVLLMKAPNVDLRLVVVDHGFDNIGPSINTVFNTLDWLRNTTTQVVPGGYYTSQEIAAGYNPGFGVPGDPSGENAARVGQAAQPIFNMFTPPLWKENGSTLYGNVGRIPLNGNPNRQYRSVFPNPPSDPFVPGFQHAAMALQQLQAEGKKAVIFSTGSLTTLGALVQNYPALAAAAIERVIIMGGGFFNFASPALAGVDDTQSQRWAGNAFVHPLYYLGGPSAPPFTSGSPTPTPPPGWLPPNPNPIPQTDWDVKPVFQSMQEMNILTDPQGAEVAFNFLRANGISTTLIPTDATDPILIADGLAPLATSPTPEGRLVFDIFEGVRAFEGAGYDFVIRLWDILAALTFLNPEIVDPSFNRVGNVAVHQLTGVPDGVTALKNAACTSAGLVNPFDVLQYDYKIGQTTLTIDPASPITIIFKFDRQKALDTLISRLNNPLNAACKPLVY